MLSPEETNDFHRYKRFSVIANKKNSFMITHGGVLLFPFSCAKHRGYSSCFAILKKTARNDAL